MPDSFPVLPGAEPWSSPGSGARKAIGILIAHGFTGNPVSTRPLGEALADKGFAIRVVRLPGHGTHFRDMLKTRYADWRYEVEHALNQFRHQEKRVIMVGLSMGGTIALDIACARPAEVAGVVTINATILNRQGLVAKAAPVLEKFIPVVPASAAGLVKNDIAKGGDEKAYDFVPARSGNSLLKELPRIRRGLERIQVPVIVAYSQNDHSVPPENSRALLDLLGKNATELVLERSYHVATLDHDLDVLVARISEFADRVGMPS